MTPPGEIVALGADRTHDLRRRVLRGGRPDAEVTWPGDDDPGTVHLGVVIDGDVVAISTWLDRHPTVQLRGMATEPVHAGSGFGRRLLDEGVRRATARGVELVWAHARIGAVGFYERCGFVTVGDVFVIPELGIPHVRVELALSAASS